MRDDLWVQCYLRQERTDSLLTINANDGTIVDWGNGIIITVQIALRGKLCYTLII